MTRRGEGRSGRSSIGNARPRLLDVGRQGSDDREHQRLNPSRQGLNNTDDRRPAMGAGRTGDEVPIDAYSEAAIEAAERIAALLAPPATILQFSRKVGDV